MRSVNPLLNAIILNIEKCIFCKCIYDMILKRYDVIQDEMRNISYISKIKTEGWYKGRVRHEAAQAKGTKPTSGVLA